MWIIPNNLQLSNGAPDTEAFISDLNEQSQICASSLMVRSKPSPARTWSQKWKRDSWTRHLSGRILKPSHAKSFVTEWTCLWPVTPANHLAQQGSGSEQKTLDTSGHTSPNQFELFDPDSVSSRMSKDTSPLDSAKSLENWKRLVIKRRGEYSARLKSARLTSASGSSSWPTTNTRDWKDSVNSVPPSVGQTRGYSLGMAVAEKNWPTTAARDYKGTSPGYLTRKDGKSRADQLAVAVDLEEKLSWPTPTVQEAGKIGNQANHGQLALSNHPAIRGEVSRDKYEKGKHGQAAPANPSTHGSRQGSWATPQNRDFKSSEGNKARWENPERSRNLNDQMKHWATPNNFCFQPPENTEQWTKRAEYQQTEKGVNLHKPIQSQVLHENEKVMGAMPPSAAKLNPRWVETLMGLPIGWTMPSCTRPVTIELTSCDCLETESSQPLPSKHLELF